MRPVRARPDGAPTVLADRFSVLFPRVGIAQGLSTAGAELPEVMTSGRRDISTMPARYTEAEAAEREAVAPYYRVACGDPGQRNPPNEDDGLQSADHVRRDLGRTYLLAHNLTRQAQELQSRFTSSYNCTGSLPAHGDHFLHWRR